MDKYSSDCELWLFKVPHKFDVSDINNKTLKVALGNQEASQIQIGDHQYTLCNADPVEYTHLVNLWPESSDNAQLKLGKPFKRMIKLVETFDKPSTSVPTTTATTTTLSKKPTVLKVRNHVPGVAPIADSSLLNNNKSMDTTKRKHTTEQKKLATSDDSHKKKKSKS